jgi:hypothetical protein
MKSVALNPDELPSAYALLLYLTKFVSYRFVMCMQ